MAWLWLDGQEITQFTYFQQAGGLVLDPVVSEILDTRDIDLFLEKADIIQIGARSQHPRGVRGAARKPRCGGWGMTVVLFIVVMIALPIVWHL